MAAYRRDRGIRARAGFIVLIIVGTMTWSSALLAKPIQPSIAELTRSAPVIAVVEMRQIQGKMIQARVREIIKGQNIPQDMDILWNSESTVESRVAHREVGERMIVFVSRKDNLFEPMFGDSSLVSVAQLQRTLPSLDKYKRAIEDVMRYDAAFPVGKVSVLLEMLNDNYFCQQSAIEIIYLEKPRDYPTEPLVQPLTVLAKDAGSRLAVSAVQALGRIADRTLIPEFIELLDSKNVYVRETAFHILQDKTRAGLAFNPSGEEHERMGQARKWSQWWNENKDRVQLHY